MGLAVSLRLLCLSMTFLIATGCGRARSIESFDRLGAKRVEPGIAGWSDGGWLPFVIPTQCGRYLVVTRQVQPGQVRHVVWDPGADTVVYSGDFSCHIANHVHGDSYSPGLTPQSAASAVAVFDGSSLHIVVLAENRNSASPFSDNRSTRPCELQYIEMTAPGPSTQMSEDVLLDDASHILLFPRGLSHVFEPSSLQFAQAMLTTSVPATEAQQDGNHWRIVWKGVGNGKNFYRTGYWYVPGSALWSQKAGAVSFIARPAPMSFSFGPSALRIYDALAGGIRHSYSLAWRRNAMEGSPGVRAHGALGVSDDGEIGLYQFREEIHRKPSEPGPQVSHRFMLLAVKLKHPWNAKAFEVPGEIVRSVALSDRRVLLAVFTPVADHPYEGRGMNAIQLFEADLSFLR